MIRLHSVDAVFALQLLAPFFTANSASIFSCSLSFILQLLFSEILSPFPFSFLLFPSLLVTKILPPFPVFFLLSLALLISKNCASFNFSISFLLPLAFFWRCLSVKLHLLSLSLSRCSSVKFCLLSLALCRSRSRWAWLACRLLSRFLCLSLSLYSKLEDIVDKICRKYGCKNNFRQPIRKIAFCFELTSLD